MNTKRRLFLFVILLFMTILIMYLIHGMITKSQRDLPEIIINNTLNVVSADNYEGDDSINSLHYELCQFISQRSGLTIHYFFEKNLDKAINKLGKNVYDVIVQSVTITKENKKLLSFTVPISQSKQMLVQRKKNDDDSTLFITNQLDLANKTIFVAKNSPAILRLKNLAEEIAEPVKIKEIAVTSTDELILLVANKKIDFAVVNNESSLKYASLFPDLDFNIEISFSYLQAWALRKTSPVLLDSLNVWITEFKQIKSAISNFKK